MLVSALCPVIPRLTGCCFQDVSDKCTKITIFFPLSADAYLLECRVKYFRKKQQPGLRFDCWLIRLRMAYAELPTVFNDIPAAAKKPQLFKRTVSR